MYLITLPSLAFLGAIAEYPASISILEAASFEEEAYNNRRYSYGN